MRTPTRLRSGPRRAARLLAAGLLTTAGLTGLVASPAQAAGEPVTAWLTTTDDAGGRHVVRGLEQQAPFS
ncbi:glucosylceramidase, partial [Streptomyces sp. NPDC048527]